MANIHFCLLLTLFFCLKSGVESQCPHKRFGINCQSGCHCSNPSRCLNETCHCANGWKGTGCNDVCSDRTFGDGCQFKCHCYNNVQCNHINGECPSGWCAAGYKGDNCQEECPTGTFGYDCLSTCHCADKSDCNNINGSCRGGNCENGYTGSACQTMCSDRTFGDGCLLKCHCYNNAQCHHINGKCPSGRCAAGYKGDNCQEECPIGTFGSNCLRTCHCADKSDCNNINGSCRGGNCENGYTGSACQTKCPHERYGNKCLSGCHCSNPSYCSYRTCRCANGWSGTGCNDAMHQTQILALLGMNCRRCQLKFHCYNDEQCYHINGKCSSGLCAAGYKGDNCQEECPLGKFGYNCQSICHCADNSNCNNINGSCRGGKCEKGYTGATCQTKCPHERYGNKCLGGCHCSNPSYCSYRTCRCANGWSGTGCNDALLGMNCRRCQLKFHCYNDEQCYHINGKCSSGLCAAGYKGDNCQEECLTGKFGYNCQSICHCADNSNCNKKNGSCRQEKCAKGYTGATCQRMCPQGTFGDGCLLKCHCKYYWSCDHITGKCSSGGCAAGYKGDNCQDECPTGKFGFACQRTCHCADHSKCSKENGTCSGGKCEKGYTGGNCQTKCPHERYGKKCQRGCHCSRSSSCSSKTCDCANGWKGRGCNEQCPTGKFGYYCQSTCYCADNSNCNKINGSCRQEKCAKGYTGATCQTKCDLGTFGDGCQLKCHCANNTQCNHINGKCQSGGCAAGYKGDNCQEVKSDPTLPLVLVAVLIIIIIIIMGVVIACYRRSKSKKRDDSKKEESMNNIPMETGDFQETEDEEFIDSENIYQNTEELTKDNLLSYVQQNKMEEEPFSSQFSKLLQNAAYPCEVGKLPENICKNRYKSLLPYDHSRVILSSDETNTNYINANYMNFQGESNYIATQGPLEATTKDFWKMIWQENCNTIVMLTNIVENGKVKCYSYWPDLNETENYGTFQVCCIQENRCMIYTHRVLRVTQLSIQEEQFVHHFQCTIWPDYGVIEEPTLFIEFRNAIRYSQFAKPPFVVHCSAGVGRTGTYIASDILLDQLWKEPSIDVFSCVNQLRHQRMSMVQKLNQYQFIYDVLAEEVLTGFSEMSINSIPDEYRKLLTREADGKTKLQNQYKEFLSPLNQSISIGSNQEEPIYTNVNRYNVFEARHKSHTEPTFVDGFMMKNEIILMDQPNKNTTEMFWKYIFDRRCAIIVMFEDSSTVDSVYWPKKIKCIKSYKSIKVELIDEIERGTYSERHFQVSPIKQKTLGPVSVVHFVCKSWQRQQFPSPSIFIDFIKAVNNCCGCGKQLLIHSKDGVTKSGLFAVLCVMISKMQMNDQLSILRLLRYFKKKNPQIASDVGAYKFCWSVAEKFQDNNSIYVNQGSFT